MQELGYGVIKPEIESRQGQKISPSPKRPNRLWDPPTLLFSGYWSCLPSLTSSGAIPPLALYFIVWEGKNFAYYTFKGRFTFSKVYILPKYTVPRLPRPFFYPRWGVLKLTRVVSEGGGTVFVANVWFLVCCVLENRWRQAVISNSPSLTKPSLKFWKPEADYVQVTNRMPLLLFPSSRNDIGHKSISREREKEKRVTNARWFSLVRIGFCTPRCCQRAQITSARTRQDQCLLTLL